MKNLSTNNRLFKDSSILNNATYNDYMSRFKKLATSIFEWVNLPESCDPRWLELCLYWFGKASFLYDNNFGFINTQAVPSGELNMYGLPTTINCWSYNYNTTRSLYTGLKKSLIDKLFPKKDDECILIMNNYEMIPTESTLQLFAMRLYEAERTIDTNIKAQKTPVLILCDEKQRLTMQNLYMKYDGNSPFIFGDKNLFTSGNGNSVQVLKTDAPFLAEELMNYKKQIWNEALTFLGINNIMEDKKERLITDEANSNNELINLNLQSYLIPRKEACKQINKKFGLNIDVRVRSDLKNIIKNLESSVTDIIDENNIDVIDEQIENKEGDINE